jgi:hypothetical protein
MALFQPAAIHSSNSAGGGVGFQKGVLRGIAVALRLTRSRAPTTATEIAHAAAPAVKREAEEEWGKGAVAIILKEKSPRLRAGDRLRFACSFYCFLVVLVSAAAMLLFVAIRRVPPVWVLVLLIGTLSTTALLATTFMATLLLTGIALVLPLILPLARVALVLRHFVVLHVLSTKDNRPDWPCVPARARGIFRLPDHADQFVSNSGICA